MSFITKTNTTSQTKVRKGASANAKAPKIKQEFDEFDDDDHEPCGKAVSSTNVASNFANASKASTSSKGPAPGTKAYAMMQMAEKGETSSPIKLAKNLDLKRKAPEACVTITKVNIFGDESLGEKDYTIAVLMGGDLYTVRDNIKAADKHATEVNGMTIPMVLDALAPRFVSSRFKKLLLAAVSETCQAFAKHIESHFDNFWLIVAPPIDDTAGTDAAIPTAVSLDEYVFAWRQALSGKPIHFDEIEVFEYFVGIHEVEFLQSMQAAKDPNYGTKSTTMRK